MESFGYKEPEGQDIYERYKNHYREIESPGYICETTSTLYAFGDAGLGDMLISIHNVKNADAAIHHLDFYHNQEPQLVSWLLSTYVQGFSQADMTRFYGGLMQRNKQAQARVDPPRYQHESIGSEYAWVGPVQNLWQQAHLTDSYQPRSEWLDAHCNDRTNPSIQMMADHNLREIQVVDHYQETTFKIPLDDIPEIVVGITVYDRGRLRPDVIRKVYAGLLPEEEANTVLRQE